MSLAGRVTGLSCTIFNYAGNDFLADCQNFTVDHDNKTKDAGGISDRYEYATLTGSKWSGGGDFYANSGTSLLTLGTANPPRGSVNIVDGANTWQGTVLITKCQKIDSRDSLLMYRVEMEGYGPPSIT